MKNFHDWITEKYIEWRGNAIGREKSISDFAKMIGVSQPLISSWMKPDGTIPKSYETIKKLADVFGPEIFSILGKDPLVYITTQYLSDNATAGLREWVENFLDADKPLRKELLKIVREARAKYGLDSDNQNN